MQPARCAPSCPRCGRAETAEQPFRGYRRTPKSAEVWAYRCGFCGWLMEAREEAKEGR